MERGIKKNIDPRFPKNPFNYPDWEDISHPKGKENGHYKFRDKKTGEEIEFDKAKPLESGHKTNDHYHRFNPNSSGDHDKYLDQNGNPIRKGSEESHLYPAN